MSEHDQQLDGQIREHYAAQSLGDHEINRLKAMIATTPAVRKTLHWMRYASAAVILLAIGMAAMVWQSQSGDRLSQAMAAQMVQQHQQPFAAEFTVEDFASLKSSMTQLAFAPTEPQRCAQDDYRVVGARYTTLQGQKVAQIRLAYVDGPQLTLYEMRRDQFPKLREGTVKLNGVPVTFWTEGDLMMALAGSPI